MQRMQGTGGVSTKNEGDKLAGAPGRITQGACKPAALRRADSGLDVFSENDAPTSPSKNPRPAKAQQVDVRSRRGGDEQRAHDSAA